MGVYMPILFNEQNVRASTHTSKQRKIFAYYLRVILSHLCTVMYTLHTLRAKHLLSLNQKEVQSTAYFKSDFPFKCITFCAQQQQQQQNRIKYSSQFRNHSCIEKQYRQFIQLQLVLVFHFIRNHLAFEANTQHELHLVSVSVYRHTQYNMEIEQNIGNLIALADSIEKFTLLGVVTLQLMWAMVVMVDFIIVFTSITVYTCAIRFFLLYRLFCRSFRSVKRYLVRQKQFQILLPFALSAFGLFYCFSHW